MSTDSLRFAETDQALDHMTSTAMAALKQIDIGGLEGAAALEGDAPGGPVIILIGFGEQTCALLRFAYGKTCEAGRPYIVHKYESQEPS